MNALDNSPRERFFDEVRAALAEGSVEKLVLAGPRGLKPDLQRVLVRPLLLKGRACLSLTYNHRTRDVTRNLPVEEGLATLAALIDGQFDNLHLLTSEGELQLAISRKGKATLRRSRVPTAGAEPSSQAVGGGAAPLEPGGEASGLPPALQAGAHAHDHAKRRFVDIAAPFLVELGVTDAEHRLIPAMARKWKQINRFVEVLDDALRAAPPRPGQPVRVLDFGAGKGYLTFAVHHHLRRSLGLEATVTGVEIRADLVQLCNDAAGRLGLEGLRFEQGEIKGHAPEGVDVLIALHACDTATDQAMHLGVRGGARIIMCSPCCHKELRPQMHGPAPLGPMLAHGVHLGQQAEMLTDSLRALLLEAQGYEAQVFEFVSLEHTSKNKMILAVERSQPHPPAAPLAQVQALKSFFGVRHQCLETLLNAELHLGAVDRGS